MSKANTWENGILDLAFLNANFAGLGDATGLRGSSTAGLLYPSLHTADPGETGDQTTSEAAYTSYTRGSGIARSSSGFTRTNNSVSPNADYNFPKGTGGGGTVTYFGIGTDPSGAGKLLYSGAASPNVPLGNGVTPQLVAATTAWTED